MLNNIDWSAFLGAFLGTLLNLLEMGMIIVVFKKLNLLLENVAQLLEKLAQFKKEGEGDKWLK